MGCKSDGSRWWHPAEIGLSVFFSPLLKGQKSRPQLTTLRGQKIFQPGMVFLIEAALDDGVSLKILQPSGQHAWR